FEGHLRSIIGSMTMEEIIRERDKLGSQVRSASGVEMEKLGLVVDSLQIKDLQDPTGYIQNIAKPHIAQVKMEARIAEATRNREAAEKEAEAAALIADAQSVSAIRQSVAQANAERAKANAAQAGPLADATARQHVVVQETEVAKLEADREEQKLQTTIRKPADAKAYAKRTDAEGQKSADISAAEALARRTELEAQVNARRTELQAQANATAAAAAAGATRVTGEAEASATKARGDAAASAIKAKALAEADGIKARAEALGTNQEAVISQQLAENMPSIIAAAAEPFAHVGQLTVLNGGEGINRMIGGILTQVGDYLPALRSALRNGREDSKRPPKAPDA
ncbi:MAG: flotillin family protein, partial [Arthrobacter sp.]|nr:flotillin family protein [Arthrobacter sp.]